MKIVHLTMMHLGLNSIFLIRCILAKLYRVRVLVPMLVRRQCGFRQTFQTAGQVQATLGERM